MSVGFVFWLWTWLRKSWLTWFGLGIQYACCIWLYAGIPGDYKGLRFSWLSVFLNSSKDVGSFSPHIEPCEGRSCTWKINKWLPNPLALCAAQGTFPTMPKLVYLRHAFPCYSVHIKCSPKAWSGTMGGGGTSESTKALGYTAKGGTATSSSSLFISLPDVSSFGLSHASHHCCLVQA